MTEDHIGKKIKAIVEKKDISVAEFSRRINTSRENVYSIFKRASLDTNRLQTICKVLTHDFFAYYTPLREENEKLKSQIKFLKSPNFQHQKMKVELNQEQKVAVSNAGDVYKVIQNVLLNQAPGQRKQEHFWVVGISLAGSVEYIELIALGKHNRVSVEPIHVFSYAVEIRCNRLILIHNHPSGNLNPSDKDILMTKQMLKAGKLIGITIGDHLIISETGYYSFFENGMVPFNLIK